MTVALPEPQCSDEPTAARQHVQTAAHCVSILVAVARSSQGLTAEEIADQMGMPRQVTYHLLHTLSGTGIVRKNGQRRYVPLFTRSVGAAGTIVRYNATRRANCCTSTPRSSAASTTWATESPATARSQLASPILGTEPPPAHDRQDAPQEHLG